LDILEKATKHPLNTNIKNFKGGSSLSSAKAAATGPEERRYTERYESFSRKFELPPIIRF
jgi:hypothetical protein